MHPRERHRATHASLYNFTDFMTLRSRILYVLRYDDRLRYRKTPERVVDAVTLSSKFQVVIPRRVRQALAWRPGVKLQALIVGDAVQFVPVQPMAASRGFARGIDTTVEREHDRI
jgi:bifunctional DNA-binding transcriptional regulator/antitoxin component of YhaV-PrlF toxin-antitoxin module